MVKRLSQRSVAARSRVRFPLTPHSETKAARWAALVLGLTAEVYPRYDH